MLVAKLVVEEVVLKIYRLGKIQRAALVTKGLFLKLKADCMLPMYEQLWYVGSEMWTMTTENL